MTYAESLPEMAQEMVTTPEPRCICIRQDIPAEWDVIEAREMKRYPRTVLKITYSGNCPYGDHRDHAGTEKIIDFWSL